MVAAQARQHLGNPREPFHVGVDLSTELELEMVQAVALDGRFQRGGQAVLRVGACVVRGQSVGQAHGVAQHHLGGAHQFQLCAPGVAQHTSAQPIDPRSVGRAQGRVGHRLVEQGRAELRGQAGQTARH
ncbi:hypothetical protein D9M69_555840 [compost metagenome]